MKTFAYCIGVFVITAIMFAIPVLATISFCLDWDFRLKGCLTACAVIDFIIVMFAISWCIEDFSDV